MADPRMFRRAVEACLKPIRERLYSLVSAATLETVDDSKGVQLVKVCALKDEVLNDLQRLQNHGFASQPPTGSEVLCVFVNGNLEHGYVVAAEKRGNRPDLSPEEAAMYFNPDHYMAVRTGGKFEFKNGTGELIDELVKTMDALIAEPFIVNKATFTAIKTVLESMKV